MFDYSLYVAKGKWQFKIIEWTTGLLFLCFLKSECVNGYRYSLGLEIQSRFPYNFLFRKGMTGQDYIRYICDSFV